jgi:hypothetical protein
MFYYATPSAPNDNSPGPSTIFINEWMAANTNAVVDPADGHFDDWFELYNPNSAPLDLSGYTLTDNLTNTARWPIPAGTTLGPHGYLLVWADKDALQNSATNADLHADFKLDKDGDEIGLFAPDGTLVDAVRFGAQADNISEGRWPDGAANTYFMPSPTPRASNAIPTNPPPQIEILQGDASPDGFFSVSWNAEFGKTYRVQYNNDLVTTNWTDLVGDIFAYGETASKADPLGIGSTPRFYRVLRVR